MIDEHRGDVRRPAYEKGRVAWRAACWLVLLTRQKLANLRNRAPPIFASMPVRQRLKSVGDTSISGDDVD